MIVTVAALAFGSMPVAGQAATGTHLRPVSISRGGSVSVHALPVRTPARRAAAMPAMHLAGSRTRSTAASAVRVVAPGASASAVQVASSFGAVGLDRQLALGPDQFVTPPDPQIAAGPTQLVEMVNSSGSIWDRQGNLLQIFDLNSFFLVPAGYSFSDPRILFDQDSQRWFASGVAFIPPTYASVVVLAVSSSADATGTWFQYTAADSSTLTHDQPKIGVSSDKFVVTWNDFFAAAFFEGESTWVLQKSQMVAGSSTVNGAALGPDSSRSSLVPAVQLASISDAYLVFNGTDCGTLGGNCGSSFGVVRISGTPLGGNLAWNETDPVVGGTSAPPAADQPGMPGSIATNDDRFLTAVLENGVLWTGGNDACMPPNDSAARACSRLVQITTAGPSVTQNFDIASTGGGLYYPAFAMDSAADMYVVYNISSGTQFIGVRVTGQAAGAPVQTVAAAQTIRAGDTTYDMNPCFGTTGASRWGDYNGAALDVITPGDVWVAGEYASVGSSANGDAGCDWSTFAAQLTFGASGGATLASISPASGPSVGGTTVTVSGTGFVSGATSFSFGAAAGTNVACGSPTTCTVTSPPGVGAVSVTAMVNGTPASGSATFSYVPSLASLTPTTGPTAGGTTVTFTGTGFDTRAGATQFTFGGTPATGVACASSTACTGITPAGAGKVAVKVTVDAIAGTGAPTFGYVPSIVSISPTSGPSSGGTQVTITGAGFDVVAGHTKFRFGGLLATGVSCSSSTTCTAVTPAGSGFVRVWAVVDGLRSTNFVRYHYL